jgi:hypothetical protein
MKRLVLAAWMAAALVAPWQAFSMDVATREWRFDVSLDGRPIGEHRYLLREAPDSRELVSEARFNVRFLFLDAYRYEHRAQERWRGDCVEQLDSRTDTNGKKTVVEMTTPPGDCVQTFAYWNPSILEARRLLNPQTGEYVYVEVTPMGREIIAGQQTERFRLLGDGRSPLEIDLWYTPARDWVALESRTPEGRRLRYDRK